jgi:hypothetical protein
MQMPLAGGLLQLVIGMQCDELQLKVLLESPQCMQ